MKKNAVRRFYDRKRYERLLRFKDDDKKEFFDVEGRVGLEIEFAVEYDRRSSTYIEVGLTKMKELIRGKGKFVRDASIDSFLNVEIVLNPFTMEELEVIFNDICTIIDFYDNFVFTENCGLHANFRADEKLKRKYYDLLVKNNYNSAELKHSKYKKDFMDIVTKKDGSIMSYDEYLEFQRNVGDKYCSVNFLKEKLLEVRSLDLKWEDVVHFHNIYVEAMEASE